jgi:hypothetical protein
MLWILIAQIDRRELQEVIDLPWPKLFQKSISFGSGLREPLQPMCDPSPRLLGSTAATDDRDRAGTLTGEDRLPGQEGQRNQAVGFRARRKGSFRKGGAGRRQGCCSTLIPLATSAAGTGRGRQSFMSHCSRVLAVTTVTSPLSHPGRHVLWSQRPMSTSSRSPTSWPVADICDSPIRNFCRA